MSRSTDFTGTEWMDDVRAWRDALLLLVGGRIDHLHEVFGEDVARAALNQGGGDSAWWDNLAAPEQARWLADHLVRQQADRRQSGQTWFVVQRRDGMTAPTVEPFTGGGAEVAAKAYAEHLAANWTEVYVAAGKRVRSGDYAEELAYVNRRGKP